MQADMNETTNPIEARAGTGIAGVVLGLTLAVATVAVFNGFPRYDFFQTALAMVGALVALLIAGRRGVPRAVFPMAATLVAIALYAIVSAAIQGTAVGFDLATLLVLMSAAGIASALAGPKGRAHVVVGSAVSAAFCMVAVIADALGFALVPEIPFASVSVAASAGTFDDPGVLAAFSVMTVALGAVGFSSGSLRAGAVSIVCGGVCLGMAGFPPLIIALGIAGIAGFALGDAKLGGAVIVGVAIAGLSLLLSGARFEAVPSVDSPIVETGVEWPYGEEHAVEFFLDGVVAYAAASQPFGAGAGAYTGEVEAHVDTEHVFARNYFAGRPTSRHSPSAAAELAGDFGFAVPLAMLVLLWLGLRKNRAVGVVAAIVGTGVLLIGPGTLSGVTMLLLGTLLGLPFGEENDRTKGAFSVVAIVALAGVVSLVHQAQTLRWGYFSESAVTFLEHPAGSREQGLDYAQRAAAVQLRFTSEMNLASARRGAGETDHAALREIYERAVQLRPRSVSARIALADAYVRESVRSPDVEERVARVGRMFEVAMTIDPNHVRLALLRANAAAASFEFEAAHEALEALAARDIPDPMRLEVLARLGELYEDAEMPAESKSAYERALPLVRDAMTVGRYEQNIRSLEQWIESGVRPQVQRVDPHLGHNHGGEGDGSDDSGGAAEHDEGGDDSEGHDDDGEGHDDDGEGHDDDGEGHDHDGEGHDHDGEGHDHDGEGHERP
ncbi:MAG: cytochrome c-type biogenesis protein CcmH/NrfG [Bradymonadia bacterium]|jgi:cytochrome c-type biogenesis protein CcmH/NrfG